MRGFKVISTIDEIELKKVPMANQTVLIGDLFERVHGATTWTACTAASMGYSRKFIAYENVTSATTQSVLGYEVRGNERVEVQSSQVGSATNNGDSFLLTDKNTVDNSGADTSQESCFVQDGVGHTTVVGATTTYSIFGRIATSASGIDPAAS